MKRLTILSGPMAGGKTHISTAIEMQHKKESVCKLYYGMSLSKIKNEFSLIVIDGIPKKKLKTIFDLITKKAPEANIVFTTQDIDVSWKEFGEFAHVINCRNDYV